jgi:cyclic-di-GMP phosphodiesterase TipF (flagellum assembly factor)
MRALLAFISKNRDLAPRLIFEIKQSDFNTMKPAILEIFRGLGRLGCSMSIDNVTSLEFDHKFLQVVRVKYIKINAKTLLAQSKTEKDFADVMRIKRKLEGNGVGFIVEKIENEFMLKELLDYDISYGQGYLFGKPGLQSAYQRQTA